jgi:hypothetical protein
LYRTQAGKEEGSGGYKTESIESNPVKARVMNERLKRKPAGEEKQGEQGEQNAQDSQYGFSYRAGKQKSKEEEWFNKRTRDPRIFYAGKQKKKYNQKQVVDALVAADGALTIAAKRLGTTYRHLKKYIDQNDKMSEVHAQIDEETLDMAEGTLRKHIEKGNLTATIFYLKTRGKKRGYIEDEKIDTSKLMQPVAIIYHSPRDPALLQQQPKQIEGGTTIDITPAELENAASMQQTISTPMNAAKE